MRYGAGRMRLRGSRDSKGARGSTAAIATTALMSWLGLLIYGKSAELPIHTKIHRLCRQRHPDDQRHGAADAGAK